MAKPKVITKGDLKHQLGTHYPRPFLLCRVCGAECSAHRGDYVNLADSYTFKCCKLPMRLVVKTIVLTEVK